MKALQFSQTGDLSALRYLDLPTPIPAAGEVLVEVRAGVEEQRNRKCT